MVYWQEIELHSYTPGNRNFHKKKRGRRGKTNNYRVFDESGNPLVVLINRDRKRKATLQNYKFLNLHNMM